jgi:hypothetical protein
MPILARIHYNLPYMKYYPLCPRNGLSLLLSSIKEKFPKAKLGVSSIIVRKDIEVSSKMYQVNEDLKRLCNESGFSFIDNSIIDESGLNNSNLYLSAK